MMTAAIQRVSGFGRSRLWIFARFQTGHEAVTIPKFYIVTVNQAFGLDDSFAVVVRGEALKTDEMTVTPDDVCPVLCHSQPNQDGAKLGYFSN
jgi:hypothetical protein